MRNFIQNFSCSLFIRYFQYILFSYHEYWEGKKAIWKNTYVQIQRDLVWFLSIIYHFSKISTTFDTIFTRIPILCILEIFLLTIMFWVWESVYGRKIFYWGAVHSFPLHTTLCLGAIWLNTVKKHVYNIKWSSE